MSESLVVVDLASSGLVLTSSTSGASPDTPFLVHRLRRFIWFPELVFFFPSLGPLALPCSASVHTSLRLTSLSLATRALPRAARLGHDGPK